MFCGYGESTERLEDLKELARTIKEEFGSKVRLNTNGLGCLVNERDIVPELAEVLDAVSISLNASDADEYMEVSVPKFGRESYDALREFIRESCEMIPDVTLSVVSGSISDESIDRCADIAESYGAHFRVR